MRISDWSSDVCSSDLGDPQRSLSGRHAPSGHLHVLSDLRRGATGRLLCRRLPSHRCRGEGARIERERLDGDLPGRAEDPGPEALRSGRSEEHTSELQSLMRISYAVFCLKKKIKENKQ